MNKQNLDIDRLTKDLLKKSLQHPASSGFDDQLMDKIVCLPAPSSRNGFSIKKAWVFWGLTLVLFLISLIIVAEILSGYFNEVSELLKLTINYVFYGGLALFMPLVLYQFDKLLQLFNLNKQKLTNSMT